MDQPESAQNQKFIQSRILKTKQIKKEVKKNTNLPKFLMKTFLKGVFDYQQVYNKDHEFSRLLRRDLKKHGSHNQSRYYNINDLSSLLSHSVPRIQYKSKDQLERNSERKNELKNKKRASCQGFKLYLPQGQRSLTNPQFQQSLVRFRNIFTSSTSKLQSQQTQNRNSVQTKKIDEEVTSQKEKEQLKIQSQVNKSEKLEVSQKIQVQPTEAKTEQDKLDVQIPQQDPKQIEYRCLNRLIMRKILRSVQNEILKSIYLKNTMTYLNATKIFALRCRNNLLVRRVQSR